MVVGDARVLETSLGIAICFIFDTFYVSARSDDGKSIVMDTTSFFNQNWPTLTVGIKRVFYTK